MNKKFITAIILLLTLSLAGAVALQALWIKNEWQSKRENFDRDVQDALNTVANRLEKEETASFLSHHFDFGTQPGVFVSNDSGNAEGNVPYSGNILHSHVEFHSHGVYDIFDTIHKQREEFLITGANNDQQVNADSQHLLVTQFEVGSNRSDPTMDRIKAKSRQLNDVWNQMVMEWSMFNVPLDQRLDIYSLHEMIGKELEKKEFGFRFSSELFRALIRT